MIATVLILETQQKQSERGQNKMNQEIITIAAAAVQRYAETHPRPPHVTQSQAAEMLGVSRSTMSRMVKCGFYKLNKVGMIPMSQIDESIAA